MRGASGLPLASGLKSEPLPVATGQLFHHPGALAMDQMETIKLFAASKGKMMQ